MLGVAKFGDGAESIVNQPPVEFSCPTFTSLPPEFRLHWPEVYNLFESERFLLTIEFHDYSFLSRRASLTSSLPIPFPNFNWFSFL